MVWKRKSFNQPAIFAALAFLIPSVPGFAETLSTERSGAELAVPAGWTLRTDSVDPTIPAFIAPDSEADEKKPKHEIHIRWPDPVLKDATLDEAVQHSIAMVEVHNPPHGSSADRNAFLGTTPVKTSGGLEGLAAEFGYKAKDGSIQYTLTKFYFKNREGKIFCVCAHVYGDRKQADTYQEIILQNLALAAPVKPSHS
jgi:hypothetical protein